MISDANPWRLKHLFADGEASMELTDEYGAYDFNSFLTTGLDKEPAFNRNPYCAYHQRIARDLMSADALIVAGYSFSDPHIDRLLLNFRNLRPENKILAIDLSKQDIEITEEYKNCEGFVGRLLQVFDVTTIPVESRNLSYKYAGALNCTNRNGYGFLYPQIWIYKKGYGEFLSEWQTVLEEWRRSRDP